MSSVLVVTLKDYFEDLSDWLVDTYFKMFVKEILILVAAYYVNTIRKKANGTYTIVNEISFANIISKDKSVLEEFFESYSSLLWTNGKDLNIRKTKGFNKPKSFGSNIGKNTLVSNELEPILSLARLVSSPHLSGAEEDAILLFENYGNDGLKVVQATFQIKGSLSKQDKASNIESAKILFEKNGTYLSKFEEDFRNFDTMSYASSNNKEGNAKHRGFWRRHKY